MRVLSENNILKLLMLTLVVTFSACKTQEKVTAEVSSEETVTETEESVPTEREVYREANTRTFNLIHTSLDVKFDWQKQQLKGKAQLTLVPYFYATDQLVLDAKGFDLLSVGLRKNGTINPLKYEYHEKQILITLDREYSKNDTFLIWIDYIAKPEELEAMGSSAITDAKGLYFINPLGEDEDKPKQIWTQGETESSSCWFPTIDLPNENMTQDISITVNQQYVTLSNGLLIDSKINGDGTRTDHWKQTKPHAPYLAMMAVGDFAIVKDKWNGIDVNYYVEHAFEPHAKAIFGETPAMLEFYSNVLDYPYTWEKYSQIVVRDFVSGAMENTTATLHGEFLQRTDRELLDGDNEEIIAHELFHHWFGDLVTCESWSNLPLNESFATYGEYLWLEHRHGRDAADRHGYSQLKQYMASTAQTGHLNLIRFAYDDKEDMFDAHSYAKGGRVLHMLRKTIGDSAFFQGLNLYLKQNEFKAVEIHQLRLAMEEITGMDLNWFFNQWFLDKGHPELEVAHNWSEEAKEYTVTIKQTQDLKELPIYRIPMDVDVYFGGGVNRYRIEQTEIEQTFSFDIAGKPSLVVVDAEKMLLGTIKEEFSTEEYLFMLKNAPLYLNRSEALEGLAQSDNAEVVDAILASLEDPFWGIRQKALSVLKNKTVADTSLLKNRLIWIAQKDKKSSVRAEALLMLADMFNSDVNVKSIIEATMKDRSYTVAGAALKAISAYNEDKALTLAKAIESEAGGSMISSIASLYSKKGTAEQFDFFISSYDKISSPNDKYVFVQIFGKYLLKQDILTQIKGLDMLEDVALNEGAWWMRMSAIQVLSGIRQSAEKLTEDADAQNLILKITQVMDKVKETETNGMIKGMLGE
ncbi:MAG: M1 family peptidase [Flavobacteriales bacterium]|nr:M1 family peptidase [Flavobacteriales bacterium]